MNTEGITRVSKLPKTVKVGTLTFDIIESDDDWNIEEGADEVNFFGQSQFFDQRIVINPGIKFDAKRETLMHELLHCCFHQTGAPLSFDDEELVVRCLAPLLINLLESNKQVAKCLIGE